MSQQNEIIREKYGQTARSGLSSNDPNVQAVAEAFGYSADELASIPAEANMGLSCGNPIAMASVREGEVVVDLGSGGGLDVFLAARKVGAAGRAIGVDMTQDMIDLANRNAQRGADGQPYTNVEFRLGQIDALPLDDASADVVISNCVINLADDKRKVFAEMFRVLKPGGRVAVSDIALKQTLPDELAQNVAALVGCIAGAIPIADYQAGLREAGFEHVAIIDSGADLTAYAKVEGASACCSPGPDQAGASQASASQASASQASEACCTPTEPVQVACCGSQSAPAPASAKPMHRELGDLLKRYDVNAYAASVKVFAVKPSC